MHLSRSWYAVVLVAVVSVGALLLNQTRLSAVLVYTAYLGLVVLLPGTIVWNAVMSRVERANGRDASERTRLEDLVCGACVGYAIELPSYAVARWLDVPRGYVLVEAAIVVAYLARARPWKGPMAARPAWGTGPSIGLGAVLSYAAVWLGVQVLSRFPLTPGGVFPDTDDPFQLALIGELRNHFPGIYPYVPDEPLAYQFFYHLHAAASTWSTGLAATEAFARFDPMIFMLTSLAGAACVARRLADRPWAGVIAAATLSLVGSYDVSGLFRGQANVEDRFLSVLLVHAPTQAMAFALVTPLVILALETVRPGARLHQAGWIAFLALAVLMTGVKVTFVPMLLAGLAGTTCLLAIKDRRRAVTGALGAAVCLTALALCFAGLYRGQSRGLTFDPLSVAEHYRGFFSIGATSWAGKLFVVVSLLCGVLVPAAGLFGLLTRPVRGDARVWLLLLASMAGLAANALLGHPGLSQRYFLYSASWFMAVASAWGLSALFTAGEARYWVYVGYAFLAGLGTFVVRWVAEPNTVIRRLPSGVTEVRSGIPGSFDVPLLGGIVVVFLAIALLRRPEGQRMAFPRGLIVVLVGLGLARSIAFALGHTEADAPKLEPVSADGLVATAWLREHAAVDDVVITNAHCAAVTNAREGKCDNRHFWMSGLSERRFLLEGWGYVGTSDWLPYATFSDAALLTTNDGLFTRPTADSLRVFAARHNVRWMLVDRGVANDLTELEAIPGVRLGLVTDGYAVLTLAFP